MNAKGIRESNPRFLKTAQRMTFKKQNKTKPKNSSFLSLGTVLVPADSFLVLPIAQGGKKIKTTV